MSTFEITIDASNLDIYDNWIVILDGREIARNRGKQKLSLEPGNYQLAFDADPAQFNFNFKVSSTGKIDLTPFTSAPNAPFRSGQDTDTLTLTGLEITIDARNLTDWGVIFTFMKENRGVSPERRFIPKRKFQLLPGNYKFQPGAGLVCPEPVTLQANGKFSYASKFDISQDGFLEGNDTSTLKILGYPIEVDATLLGDEKISLINFSDTMTPQDGVPIFKLLPAGDTNSYGLLSSGGTVTSSAGGNGLFSVKLDGTIQREGAFSDKLKLRRLFRVKPR
jgi:hypothetical protein